MLAEAPFVGTPVAKTEQPAEDLGINILRQARFALGWNSPAVAGSTLARNQARVEEYAKRAQFGSPGQRAEERFVLARAKQDIRRVRAAGLVSGTIEEGATGMIFAIPANRERADEPTSIGDTPHELWYMPYQAIEEALAPSHADQASNKPTVDKYVYRAALGFVATQEDSHDPEQIRRIDLHPVDAANLLGIARYMKRFDLHGRIPSRVDIITQRLLHTAQFNSSETPVNLAARHQRVEEQETRIA